MSPFEKRMFWLTVAGSAVRVPHTTGIRSPESVDTIPDLACRELSHESTKKSEFPYFMMYGGQFALGLILLISGYLIYGYSFYRSGVSTSLS
jgi:hypothetical protein